MPEASFQNGDRIQIGQGAHTGPPRGTIKCVTLLTISGTTEMGAYRLIKPLRLFLLTDCGLMTPHGDKDLGQHMVQVMAWCLAISQPSVFNIYDNLRCHR